MSAPVKIWPAVHARVHAAAAAIAIVCSSAFFAQACTKTATSTGPSPAKCQVSVPSGLPAVAASGGSTVVDVTAQPECAWSAVAGATWITELKPSTGQGNGQIEVVISPNGTAAGRQTNVTINGSPVPIAQAGVACDYRLTGPTGPAGAGGATVTIAIATAPGCAWSASTSASWLTATSALTGTGSGNVTFTAAANPGAARSGPVTIAGQSITVSQNGAQVSPRCTYTINPASQAAAAAGGPISVSVTTGGNCSWAAASSASWIAIVAGASGTGNGTVSLSVAGNAGAARSATVSIADKTLSVSQAAAANVTPCTFALSGTAQTVAASAGAGAPVTVTTTSGCTWTVSSAASWITVTGGTNTTGNGSAAFAVTANTGAERSGTLTIAGQTYTVTQSAAASSPPPTCAYTINPTSQSLGNGGGNGTPIGVTTTAGCAWTAVSNNSWLSIGSGASGSGPGSVTFAATANNGGARQGTLTVAGRTFTVSQSAACTVSISPGDQNFGEDGGTGTVQVTAAAGCAWTAVASTSWITVTSGASGTGNGTVRYSIATNPGNRRTGNIAIGGRTFNIVQSKH